MISCMPFETCWAFNKLWNNKLCCKVASCWLFLLIQSYWIFYIFFMPTITLNFSQDTNFNSNKSPTRCNNFPVYYPDVYLQLNMFRVFSCPSSGAQWVQWQPLVLPSYRGNSRAVFVVGLVTTNTARLSPRHEGKTSGYYSSHWNPNDGRENARNMLSCK
jgi:hypothetical protein